MLISRHDCSANWRFVYHVIYWRSWSNIAMRCRLSYSNSCKNFALQHKTLKILWQLSAPRVLSSLNTASVVCCLLASTQSCRTLPFPSMTIFYNRSVSLKWWNCTLRGEAFWIQDTTHSLDLEKDKRAHYLRKQVIVTTKCKINSFPWFILFVSTCMQKHLLKYIHMKVYTQRMVFSLL